MRKTLIASLIGLSMLAACSTEKESASTTEAPVSTAGADTTAPSDTTPADAVVDPRAPGVTADTIKIGVTYDDLRALKSIIGFDHGDYETAYNSLVDEINANGGVAGRKIELVFAPVDPGTSDAGAAACTKLVEDEGVFLVMGFFLEDEVLCYVDNNSTIIFGGTQTDERLAKSKVLWLTTDPGQNQGLLGLQTLADEGKLGDKLAVVGTTGDESLYDASVKPILDAAGIDPLEVAYVDSSSGDANAVADAVEVLAERFKADGATQVLMIGNSGAYFPTGLARTDFRPQLIFQNINAAGTYGIGEGNDLSVMEGAISSGPFSSANDFEALTDEATKACLATQTAAGLSIVPEVDVPKGESLQATGSFTACRNLTLLVAILEKVGADLNYGTFTTAAYSLGEISLPGTPDPWTFGRDSLDGSPVLYVYEWDAAAKKMVNTNL